MRKIVTVHEYPPIPDRRFDWIAHYEGDEEHGPRGYGATEAEAIADLSNNWCEGIDFILFGEPYVKLSMAQELLDEVARLKQRERP